MSECPANVVQCRELVEYKRTSESVRPRHHAALTIVIGGEGKMLGILADHGDVEHFVIAGVPVANRLQRGRVHDQD